MPRFAIKLVFIPFDKYKNKSKNQRLSWIKIYNYQIAQSHSKNQWDFFVHMKYTSVSIKKNQFLLSVFIDISNLIVIPTGIFKKNNGVKSNTDSLSQRSFLPGTSPKQNSVSPENLPLLENLFSPENFSLTTFSSSEFSCFLINVISIKKKISTGNAILLGNSYLVYFPPPVNLRLPLDPYLQEIEESLMVKPCDQPSESLNKKRSQKDDYFEQSTQRELSRFEYVECDFSLSQRGICRTGIWGNVVQKSQHRPQNQPGNQPQNQPQNRS